MTDSSYSVEKSLPSMRKSTVKRKKKVPFTKVPTKKYPFPVPIPPCSVVSVKRVARSPWSREVGRVFRIGYYGQIDGLDCIWLVDKNGKYSQTLDHECLHRFFKIDSLSKERSRFGRGIPKFGPFLNT
jgi:hypothetical protein